MKPKTISEMLLFCTVKLFTDKGTYGTGYFFNFNDGGKHIPVIVTNRHVVNDNTDEDVTFYLHLRTGEEESDESYKVHLSTTWFFHHNKDLCFTFAQPIFDEVKKNTGKDVYYKAVHDSLVPTQADLDQLSALEELVMIGYPAGMRDSINNFPVFRTGHTASHPAYDFNEKGIALVDMSCFPGSSGSPIFLYNEFGYSDKEGNFSLGRPRLIFLGTLSSSVVYSFAGKLVKSDAPPISDEGIESHTRIPTNLGVYIKACELKELNNVAINFAHSHRKKI